MNNICLLIIGTRDGLEYLSKYGSCEEFQDLGRDVILNSIDIRQENIRLLPQGNILRCSKFTYKNNFYSIYSIYKYARDNVNRFGFISGSLILKDLAVQNAIHIFNLFEELNKYLDANMNKRNHKISMQFPDKVELNSLSGILEDLIPFPNVELYEIKDTKKALIYINNVNNEEKISTLFRKFFVNNTLSKYSRMYITFNKKAIDATNLNYYDFIDYNSLDDSNILEGVKSKKSKENIAKIENESTNVQQNNMKLKVAKFSSIFNFIAGKKRHMKKDEIESFKKTTNKIINIHKKNVNRINDILDNFNERLEKVEDKIDHSRRNNIQNKPKLSTRLTIIYSFILLLIIAISAVFAKPNILNIFDLLISKIDTKDHEQNIISSSGEVNEIVTSNKIFQDVSEVLKSNEFDRTQWRYFKKELNKIIRSNVDLDKVGMAHVYMSNLKEFENRNEQDIETISNIEKYLDRGENYLTFRYEFSHESINIKINLLDYLNFNNNNIATDLRIRLEKLKQHYHYSGQRKEYYYNNGYRKSRFELEQIKVEVGEKIRNIARKYTDSKNSMEDIIAEIEKNNPKDVRNGKVINDNSNIIIYLKK